MKVSDVMVPEVMTCNDSAPLGEAARIFWEKDIGFLPVLSAETGRLIGVITDRDTCLSAYFQGKPLWEIPVRAAMSMNIVSVEPDATVDEAEERMSEAQVHRLPVVTADGDLVGVISINDIARRAAADEDEELEEEVALTLGAITQPRNGSAVLRS